ncbi:MAG: hypothetical protein FWB96_08760 [Defluviitaleaceae bacterium]|nr:hypothetical protein [Defluviitaleaceae bacterium]
MGNGAGFCTHCSVCAARCPCADGKPIRATLQPTELSNLQPVPHAGAAAMPSLAGGTQATHAKGSVVWIGSFKGVFFAG